MALVDVRKVVMTPRHRQRRRGQWSAGVASGFPALRLPLRPALPGKLRAECPFPFPYVREVTFAIDER